LLYAYSKVGIRRRSIVLLRNDAMSPKLGLLGPFLGDNGKGSSNFHWLSMWGFGVL